MDEALAEDVVDSLLAEDIAVASEELEAGALHHTKSGDADRARLESV